MNTNDMGPLVLHNGGCGNKAPAGGAIVSSEGPLQVGVAREHQVSIAAAGTEIAEHRSRGGRTVGALRPKFHRE